MLGAKGCSTRRGLRPRDPPACKEAPPGAQGRVGKPPPVLGAPAGASEGPVGTLRGRRLCNARLSGVVELEAGRELPGERGLRGAPLRSPAPLSPRGASAAAEGARAVGFNGCGAGGTPISAALASGVSRPCQAGSMQRTGSERLLLARGSGPSPGLHAGIAAPPGGNERRFPSGGCQNGIPEAFRATQLVLCFQGSKQAWRPAGMA